jgi:L-ascorbate metabolism protein UlaG (beta-lactamase superfamily)
MLQDRHPRASAVLHGSTAQPTRVPKRARCDSFKDDLRVRSDTPGSHRNINGEYSFVKGSGQYRAFSRAASVAALLALPGGACAEGSAADRTANAATAPDEVTLTWLSVTSWLLEAGDTRVLFDGYVSRVDRTTVNTDGSSTSPARLDMPAVERVRDAVLPDRELDWILVGHGHWDHAFDTPAWAQATGARIAGARSVCLFSAALGVPSDRCVAVEGGEVLELGPGIRGRAVRWHHSGDESVDGRVLRAPLELRETPSPDPTTGGLRPGYLEDYPNGGGARAWLITVETATSPLTIFWSNTGNPHAWEVAIAPDSALFREQGIDIRHLEWAHSDRPTREHLRDALAGERLDAVDVWIGFGGRDHVRQVADLLRPRRFVPHHWDDFWTPLEDGPGRAFPRTALDSIATRAGFELIVPQQFFDRIRLGTARARLEDGAALREALGIRAYTGAQP